MPFGAWGVVSEAAAHYGVSTSMIHKLIKKGSLGDCKKMVTPRGSFLVIPYPFVRKQWRTGVHTKDRKDSETQTVVNSK